MRDLSPWRRRFEPEWQRLEAHDPRFQHAADLAQGGKYTEAANAVEALREENLYEVRLLGYPLHAALVEDGLERLPELLQTLAECIRHNWGELPAGDKQAVLLNKGLTWLFRTLLDTVTYHQTRQDERWSGWMRNFPEQRAAEALGWLPELRELLKAPVYHSGAELLARLGNWVQELKGKLAQAQQAQKTQQEEQARSTASAPAPPPAEASTFMRVGQVVQLHGSAHFVELNNKLRAFELLVQHEDFEKAALVSDDILTLLGDFDPRRYFPQLFTTFSTLLSRHVRKIQPHWENKETVEWKTLTQFYQVDLEGFVKQEE